MTQSLRRTLVRFTDTVVTMAHGAGGSATPYGDRRAMVRDPFGNVFQIAHVIRGRCRSRDAGRFEALSSGIQRSDRPSGCIVWWTAMAEPTGPITPCSAASDG